MFGGPFLPTASVVVCLALYWVRAKSWGWSRVAISFAFRGRREAGGFIRLR